MTLNKENPDLSFSDSDIVVKASRLGISLGSKGHEVAISVNELLDSGTNSACVMLQKTVVVTPPGDVDPDGLLILVVPRDPDEDKAPESHIVDSFVPPKVRRTRTKKQYDPSVVFRSIHNKVKKKFHEE